MKNMSKSYLIVICVSIVCSATNVGSAQVSTSHSLLTSNNQLSNSSTADTNPVIESHSQPIVNTNASNNNTYSERRRKAESIVHIMATFFVSISILILFGLIIYSFIDNTFNEEEKETNLMVNKITFKRRKPSVNQKSDNK